MALDQAWWRLPQPNDAHLNYSMAYRRQIVYPLENVYLPHNKRMQSDRQTATRFVDR